MHIFTQLLDSASALLVAVTVGVRASLLQRTCHLALSVPLHCFYCLVASARFLLTTVVGFGVAIVTVVVGAAQVRGQQRHARGLRRCTSTSGTYLTEVQLD